MLLANASRIPPGLLAGRSRRNPWGGEIVNTGKVGGRIGLRVLAGGLLAGAAVLVSGAATAVAGPGWSGGQIQTGTLADTGGGVGGGPLGPGGGLFFSGPSKGG